MKRNNKRKNKSGRVLVNVMLLVLVFSVFGVLTSFNYADKEVKTTTILVEQQDTLWNIAKKICGDDDSLNIRNIISQIKDINGMQSSSIYEGQELVIPIY